MMNRVLLVCVLLLCSGTMYARTKSDVLVMTNGDHLTCEIKGLGAGVLYASFDYILSTQSVEWSKVDHIESKQLFIVRTENGSVYTGTLATVGAPGHAAGTDRNCIGFGEERHSLQRSDREDVSDFG